MPFRAKGFAGYQRHAGMFDKMFAQIGRRINLFAVQSGAEQSGHIRKQVKRALGQIRRDARKLCHCFVNEAAALVKQVHHPVKKMVGSAERFQTRGL